MAKKGKGKTIKKVSKKKTSKKKVTKKRAKPLKKRKCEDKFDSWVEQRSEEFAQEVGGIGKRFGKHMEHKTKEWEKKSCDWWFLTFGIVGPLIGSIFGIVFIAFGIWLLNSFNVPLGSSFISSFSSFLLGNLHWFFVIFIFFGYKDYFSKRFPKIYWTISPIFTSVGIVIFFFILIWVINLFNKFAGSSFLEFISGLLYANLFVIFLLFVVLGYIFIFIKKHFKCHWCI